MLKTIERKANLLTLIKQMPLRSEPFRFPLSVRSTSKLVLMSTNKEANQNCVKSLIYIKLVGNGQT